jgi:DNA uptake protein ComE-like DNA-binding protein
VGGITSLSTTPIKQGPFESVEELALVNGGTDLSLLYGLDTNLNHVIDPQEGSANATSLAQAGIGTPTLGLFEYLTTYSREPNIMPGGTKRVDVTNLAGAALPAMLNQVLGAGSSRQIMAPLRASRAKVNNVLDFYYQAHLTPEQLDQLTPYLTISGANFQTGMINVNTADPTVLSCVPGITYDLASQIVSQRQQQTTPWTNLAAVASILGQANASQAGRYLTTYSYQWRVDVAAVGRYGRGYRRVQMVIDDSTGTPQIVYRRDLSNAGWALGADERQALAQQLPGAGAVSGGAAQ